MTFFKRDSLITYVKNDNYWRKGYPYLDGVEIRYIPDLMTSAAMMEAEPEKRYRTPRDLMDALEPFARGKKSR